MVISYSIVFGHALWDFFSALAVYFKDLNVLSKCIIAIGCYVFFQVIFAFAMNISLIKHIKKSHRRISHISFNLCNSTFHSKATKTILLISFLFVFTYTLLAISLLYVGIQGLVNPVRMINTCLRYGNLSMSPVLLNSVINSLIYMYRNNEIMRFYKNMYRNIKCNSVVPE